MRGRELQLRSPTTASVYYLSSTTIPSPRASSPLPLPVLTTHYHLKAHCIVIDHLLHFGGVPHMQMVLDGVIPLGPFAEQHRDGRNKGVYISGHVGFDLNHRKTGCGMYE